MAKINQMKFTILLHFLYSQTCVAEITERICEIVEQQNFEEDYLKGKYVETLYDVYNERLNFYDEIEDQEAPDPTKPSRRTREIHRFQRRIISQEGKSILKCFTRISESKDNLRVFLW